MLAQGGLNVRVVEYTKKTITLRNSSYIQPDSITKIDVQTH